MEKLKAKLKKQGGFTLVEMLIVVAIIAILVAVSIPLVNSALERAREATDAANERSFKALLTIAYTLGEYEDSTGTKQTFDSTVGYQYDAANGVLSTAKVADANKGYGKSTAYLGVDNEPRAGCVLDGAITDGKVCMTWVTAGSAPTKPAASSKLISPLMVNATPS